MTDTNKMKKADWIQYASELERKLKKAEAEVERIRAEREDKVRAEIRSEERKEWIDTGLIMARDEIEAVLEEMQLCDEISFDLYYRLKYTTRDTVDSIDVASIVE